MTKNVQNTELHMAAFLAEHDLSFNLMDHMIFYPICALIPE